MSTTIRRIGLGVGVAWMLSASSACGLDPTQLISLALSSQESVLGNDPLPEFSPSSSEPTEPSSTENVDAAADTESDPAEGDTVEGDGVADDTMDAESPESDMNADPSGDSVSFPPVPSVPEVPSTTVPDPPLPPAPPDP